MFIDDDIIEITLFCKPTGCGSMKVLNKNSWEEIPESDRSEFEKHVFKAKAITWKQHNDIQRSATVSTHDGLGNDIDWVQYKEEKLLRILVGWDAKDKEGKEVQLSKANIFRLQPVIAESLLNEFDRITLVGEDDRKNS